MSRMHVNTGTSVSGGPSNSDAQYKVGLIVGESALRNICTFLKNTNTGKAP